MLARLIRLRWPIPVALLALGVLIIGGGILLAGGGGDKLVVYNGRSHYGDEDVFRAFEEATGIEVELRGGTAPDLFQRLRSEGDDSPADVFITTDLANLWRADEAGLLEPVSTSVLEEIIPEGLRASDGAWWAISTRLRVPVVATDRVDPSEVTSYESLGDPAFAGRTCLRVSTNEYNQSLVADFLAKRGPDATEALLRSWMDNDPEIIGSDGELLAIMADGGCDVGLVNHYYLARTLAEDPDFPVAPAWPDQDGAGAHANVSGMGLVRGSDSREDAIALMEYLVSAEAQAEIVEGGEFAANPNVSPAEHISEWAGVRIDPIAVDDAGPLLAEAVELMLEVGWR